MSLTWLFFFSQFLFFGRATERKQRADVLCNAKTGTGTGEWAMESECNDTCVLHPSCVSTTNPHCWGAMSRRTSNGGQRLDMMCLKGASGTPYAIKHAVIPRTLLSRPSWRHTFWLVSPSLSRDSVDGSPFRANSCQLSSERGNWIMVGHGREPNILRDLQKCHCGLLLGIDETRGSVQLLSQPSCLCVAQPRMDQHISLATDRLTALQWLSDTENHRSSAATYRQYSRLMSGTMSSSRQTTLRRTGRTTPRTPSTSYTCATRRFPSKTRRHYYNE